MSARAAGAVRLWRRLMPRERRATDDSVWAPDMRVVSREAPPALRTAFVAAGYRQRFFFPHRVHRLPKCGPDGFVLAERMCGVQDVSTMWQIVLFATAPAIDEFPREIFFDRDLLWHQQHFGRAGQVASVDLVVHGGTLYTMAHQSDLVQRVSRRRDLKTRVEKVFAGWHHLLLNAIAGFAVDRGLREIRVPSSTRAMQHTDVKRRVSPELFERVYDRAVHQHFRSRLSDGWWCIDVAENRHAVVALPSRVDTIEQPRTVCICHDIERGWGHRDAEAGFARRADDESPAALERMLAVERAAGIRCTYNVLGLMLDEVRARIERDGHALAFHSYDHDLARPQLGRCRAVDYRIKGYRAPQSRLTEELRNHRIHRHNVEWLASSPSSLGVTEPGVSGRMARLPVAFDDYPLHTGRLTYGAWRRQLLDRVAAHQFTAFGLHDCYAAHWLGDYDRLLGDVAALARPRTLDDVAADLYLAAGA